MRSIYIADVKRRDRNFRIARYTIVADSALKAHQVALEPYRGVTVTVDVELTRLGHYEPGTKGKSLVPHSNVILNREY